eukprot:TRINITY_DN3623_c0_g1_i1.p1 TRINITY_DN3623_c0_g1~~TRINITY_DN3623_c0_g1_i1.p1  ORF type:complete len:771 (-),score=274.77 TRINITY_DN3623_c0_g1_i1:155-2467(-)
MAEVEKKEKAKRVQPKWVKPEGGHVSGLKVKNSLKLESLEDLVPSSGKLLRWYTCGPTVYDSSHLGHARNYLTFDILKRIVENYFGYEVFYCMNITDIDDKIILRSRRNHFYAEYFKEHTKISQTNIDDLTVAWEKHIEGLKKKLAKNEDDKQKQARKEAELDAEKALLEEKLATSIASFKAVKELKGGEDAAVHLEAAEEPLSVILDDRKGKDLDSEFVKKLCDAHAKKYEKEFFDDMRRLGISMPDVIVRVSEYIPEVIEMCEKIISNGFGYVSDGSVYFDSVKFHNTPGHTYGKLAPWSIGNLDLINEGEGSLAATEKRKSPADFALWKKSKPGEPSWTAPEWGQGRPGWHIECSAMASKILGANLDVHCGGHDLKFPHHDNEIAQSEAYYGHDQWVNYFLHSGHLDIDGLKMSKSLKNFITIRDALKSFTPRQMRILFLLQAWDKKMNYQRKGTMHEVEKKEKMFTEFFMKISTLQALSKDTTSVPESWNAKDTELNAQLLTAIEKVDVALKNNFNTFDTITALSDLVNKANSYLAANEEKKVLLLSRVADYVKKIWSVFGVDFQGDGGSGGSVQEVKQPFAKAISDFRKQVRQGVKDKQSPQYFMQLCDSIRDDVLPPLGVKIVDDSTVNDYFLVDPKELVEEIAKKKKEQQTVALNKKKASLQAKQKELVKLEKSKLTPKDYIKQNYFVTLETEEEEIPNKNEKGEDVSGGTKKKIKKDWKTQASSYEKFMADLAKNPNLVSDLEKTIEQLDKEIKEIEGPSNV